ncbi:MAG: gamma carbonic anhydrase family protein [Megasphaera sp.]|jgi:carbonic anhydrase/acetyltransferase-like protein (isoleucine patch superfamily)|nr:gamma carbonic anhydrase family protein [Megasphaera sp.]MCI1248370.1 gamma carbonic anhydrase family protein [Megasphaera sp.]
MSLIQAFDGHTPQIDPTAYIAESAVIIGDVIIEEGASIWPNAVIRGDAGRIVIGRYADIQDNVTMHTPLGCPLTIGEYTVIGHNAVIHCTSVGKTVLIGMGCVLLDHAEIGDESIIGASTLITQRKKIPWRSMVYGTPFKIIRTVTDEEVLHTHKEAEEYFTASRGYMR